MTNTETTFAKNLLPGDGFFAQGEWRMLDHSVKHTTQGYFLNSTDGESFYFLGYESLPFTRA